MKTTTARAYARAGLLGNPSDGYNGKTISFIIGNYFAEVVFSEAPQISIRPAAEEKLSFASIDDLYRTVTDEGYYGSERLVKAALKRFVDYFRDALDSNRPNFSVSVQSGIPRMVGLAGSSAIVMATLRAAMAWYGVTIEPTLLASLTLSVERDELKIPAGLQDRVIQALEGTVYMDFSQPATTHHRGMDVGKYIPLDLSWTKQLYVAFSARGGEPTEVLHGDLRSRFNAGDHDVVMAMRQFAEFAEQGKTAIEKHDVGELHRLINSNFDLRRSICHLNPHHVEMIERARSVGASAKYCGSGGAIVGTFTDEKMFEQLKQTLAGIGCHTFQPRIGHFQAAH